MKYLRILSPEDPDSVYSFRKDQVRSQANKLLAHEEFSRK